MGNNLSLGGGEGGGGGSDSSHILGLLWVTLCSEPNIFFIDKNIIFSTQRWGGGVRTP